jgi:hypothetical protein
MTEPDAARSAYEAGDLDALIAMMTEAQQLAFKMAVVRQAIAYLEAILPPKEADDGERSALYPARRWLDDPTEANATEVAIFITMEYADGGLRYSDYGRIYIEAAEAAATTAPRAARHALETAPDAEKAAARAWQVAAAWAILQEAAPPSLDGTT